MPHQPMPVDNLGERDNLSEATDAQASQEEIKPVAWSREAVDADKPRRDADGGFNRSSQRWLVDMIADTRPVPRQVSSIRVSCGGGC